MTEDCERCRELEGYLENSESEATTLEKENESLKDRIYNLEQEMEKLINAINSAVYDLNSVT